MIDTVDRGLLLRVQCLEDVHHRLHETQVLLDLPDVFRTELDVPWVLGRGHDSVELHQQVPPLGVLRIKWRLENLEKNDAHGHVTPPKYRQTILLSKHDILNPKR